MGGESVGNPAGPDTGIAAGDDIDGRITDHESLFGAGSCLLKQGASAQWIRFFSGETVAAVHMNKIFGQPERFHDRPGGVYGFV